MKTYFAEARSVREVVIPEGLLQKLSGKVALFTTVQFIGSIKKMTLQLESNGSSVRLHKPKHSRYNGQVLGCSIEKYSGLDFILYVGDGLFHPIALSLKNVVPIHTFNPISNSVGLITEDMKKRYQQRTLIGIKKFYMSNKIGILVSTKPGQMLLNKAIDLCNSLEKECYILLSDDIEFDNLENFPFIECYVNTACPRISYDDFRRIGKPIVSIDEIMPVK